MNYWVVNLNTLGWAVGAKGALADNSLNDWPSRIMVNSPSLFAFLHRFLLCYFVENKLRVYFRAVAVRTTGGQIYKHISAQRAVSALLLCSVRAPWEPLPPELLPALRGHPAHFTGQLALYLRRQRAVIFCSDEVFQLYCRWIQGGQSNCIRSW